MRLAPIVLLLLAAPLLASEEEPLSVLDQLRSESAAVRAWGAYRAGKENVEAAVPRLIDMIREVPEHKDKEGRLLARAAFDALIRLRAPVRAEILTPHLNSRFRAQATILFAPHARRYPEVLLRQFDGRSGDDLDAGRIAIGNLLAIHRVPGFAPRLLRRLKFCLYVAVVDDGIAGRGGSSRMLARSGDGRLDVPEGFPPTVFYRLTMKKKDGAVRLVDGPRPVYWIRTERTGTKIGFGSTSGSVGIRTLAREWLALLGGIPRKKLPLREYTSMSVKWTDAEDYASQVAKRRNAILLGYWKLVVSLLEKEALFLDEACALKPEVRVEVTDQRKLNRTVLPDIPAPPARPVLPGERTVTPEPEKRPAK